jgi:hypothetical protein
MDNRPTINSRNESADEWIGGAGDARYQQARMVKADPPYLSATPIPGMYGQTVEVQEEEMKLICQAWSGTTTKTGRANRQV